ncbi:MAG: amidohydrolase family protein [Deltaproteobacteria bacterium]|nr:amidohydrolase family protein [Deltaproteobacteria bacterium]
MREDAWLARTPEEALEPERPICDPHHHLWQHPESSYVTADLLADTREHRVVETVFVECSSGYRASGPEALRPVGETDYVEKMAAESAGTGSPTDMAAGIVGFADLRAGAAVREVLEAHLEASPRFRGIRHANAWHRSDQIRRSHVDPPEGLLGQADFREGLAVLGRLGLSFDAWMFHTQIAELTDLARAVPDVPIVLDHVGGPLGIGPFTGKRADVYAAWQPAISELASCENVSVKVGGMTMPINGFEFHKRDTPPGSVELAEALSPWYLHVIERFGPDRCMFESNFPVDRASCSYTVLWNAFKRMSSGYSESERDDLFRGTARRFYRLGD